MIQLLAGVMYGDLMRLLSTTGNYIITTMYNRSVLVAYYSVHE